MFHSNKIFIFLFSVSFIFMAKAETVNTLLNSFIEVDANSIGPDNKIQGKMNINGVNYNAQCDCNPVTPTTKSSDNSDTNGPKCDPSKLSIHLEKTGQGASQDDLRNLIGNIEELNYVKVPSASFKCLDGRSDEASMSTPGGDAGEFILALTVFEDLRNNGLLTQDNIDLFFTRYLKLMPHARFYMCTDDKAISHLEKDLKIEGLNIINPRKQIIPELFEKISEPENNGDLHLKMLLKYPQRYAIRKEIVIMFLKSFYKILWNKDDELYKKLNLEVLSGDHIESAFVEVRSENACQIQQLVPLLPTKNKVISVFVNHLDAASIRRALIANFFSKSINMHMDAVDPVKMSNRLNHHGFIALEETGSFIAKDLPFYTINLA